MHLPIYDLQNDIIQKLSSHQNLIITSPTGSGKSTQLPKIILNHSPAKRILVLQPRRLAAIMLAKRVADEMQCNIGSTVGYITRFERAYCADTQICFITTGVLPRMLLHDQDLKSWDTIIFDEFHERSCLQDISFALCREIQHRRNDLKIIIMSATLNTKEIQEYLPNSTTLAANGSSFPVAISYLPQKSQQTLWDAAKKALVELLNSAPGDILIFMPGAFEINKTIEACKEISSSEKLIFLPLYSNLPSEQQQLISAPFDGRKIIVATNIAETSVTISGVRHVIDSGLAKVNRFNPTKGINLLEIEPISDFSATQRAGRAGREAAGNCIRLWRENNSKIAELEPEVRRIDLSEAILLISRFGFHTPDSFPWFTTPRSSSVNVAFELLIKLGLLNSNGTLTTDGSIAVTLPIHPRFSKMLLTAQHYNAVPEAALCAALLSERPILLNGNNRLRRLASFFEHRGESVARRQPRLRVVETIEETDESDIIICLRAIQYLAQQKFDLHRCNELGINRAAALTIWKSFEHIISNIRKTTIDCSAAGSFIGLTKSILSSFPDRLACRRDETSLICYTAFGRAEISPESITCKSRLFITTDIRQLNSGKQLLTGNLAINEAWIKEIFPNDFIIEEQMFWHDVNQRIEKHHIVKCLGVKIEDKVIKDEQFYQNCGKLL
ncbi:MAG: DEAD/DEAH box helicase, partial [Lentisphaeria bacterium]